MESALLQMNRYPVTVSNGGLFFCLQSVCNENYDKENQEGTTEKKSTKIPYTIHTF